MNREINNVEMDLLRMSAKDLIVALSENEELTHVKQSSFEYYNEEEDKYYQVQVLVTRDESDFLRPFEIEEMSNF